jgi:hypothetical protein
MPSSSCLYWFAVEYDKLARKTPRCCDGDLLTKDGTRRQLESVPSTGCTQAGTSRD